MEQDIKIDEVISLISHLFKISKEEVESKLFEYQSADEWQKFIDTGEYEKYLEKENES
jgi:hypothetical protein